MATRPTTDKVRQALFSVLGDLQGAKVADLYAGSGALGIEALSRGAVSALFVESARPAQVVLRRNLESLGLQQRAQISTLPVERAAEVLRKAGPFDLIFADPPWAQVPRVLELLTSQTYLSLLAPGGALLLEHPSRLALVESLAPEVACTKLRTWGDTAIAWLSPRAPEGEAP